MDELDDDPKITRLPKRGPALAHGSVVDVRREVEQMLAEAEREPAPEPHPAPRPPEPAAPIVLMVPDAPKRPPSRHRNAMICPQCDEWTWRATQLCIHCGGDLFAFARQQTEERQRRWHVHRQQQLLRWAVGLIGGGLVAVYFAPSLPAALRPTAVTCGLVAIFGGFVCGKMLD